MTEPGPLAGLGRRMARGAAWTVALRVAVRGLGLLSTIILARLLVPADFGLIALATLLAASLELLSAFNFRIWLLRHPNPEREHYDTVWTLSIIRGALTCVGLWLLAHPAGAFFNEPRLADVVMILGVATAVGAFQNVGIIDFQKYLDFDKDFRLLLGVRFGSFIVTVSLAFWLRTYWALVAGLAAIQLLTLILSYTMHSFRPRLSLRRWREAFDFSKWLLVGNLLLFLYTRADTFILGRLVNSQLLGLYTMAHEIAELATSELVEPLRRVMLPGYAQMMVDTPALKRGFVDGFALVLLIGFPCAAGIGLTADPVVRVLLGEKWLESIPLIQILVVYGLASVALANQGPILLALGYTRLLTALTAIGLAIIVPAFTWASTRFGLSGGAWAVGVTHMAMQSLTLAMTLRVLHIPARDVLRDTWRIAAATSVMTLSVLAVQAGLEDVEDGPVAMLAMSVVTGAIAYAATVLALWHFCGRPKGPEHLVVAFVRERLDK